MMIVVTALSIVDFTGIAFGQQESLKEQLIGAWNLVSIDYVRADGGRSTTFGDNPNGIAFFDSGNRQDRPHRHIRGERHERAASIASRTDRSGVAGRRRRSRIRAKPAAAGAHLGR